CHSNSREADFEKWLAAGSYYLPGQDLETQVTMHRFGLKETQTDYADGHWMDGTARTGGDEYLGMIQSPCYTQGELSCLSCHSLHNYASPIDQMIPQSDENESCLKCHESMRNDIGRHTHHEEDSSGSLCINCHMPHTSYALFKGIRSHRIVSPNATESAKSGRPNACNLCHLDQTLAWTANQLEDWYQQPIPDLHPQQEAVSSTLRHALRGDAAQRVIAAWNLGWQPATEISKTDWQAPILAQLLDDPYSVVRYVAFRSLKELPGFQDLEYDFLSDSESRQEAASHVLETWRQQGKEAARAENGRLLLNSEGQLDEGLLNQLLNERDDRPIVIAE
ncbi:MAG: cytochrome c3 family protein, partial [Planctomycetota bacterium]|nr:cytochrome c3 family protein [Planctomycetota bacterium]